MGYNSQFELDDSAGPAPPISLARALELWIEVTGVDPSTKTRWTLGELDIQDMHRALRDALEIDETEITGLMLFDYVATEYFSQRSFSVDELIDEPQRVADYLDRCRQLRTFLGSDRLKLAGARFTSNVLAAIEGYGAAHGPIRELVADRHRLALLRRDAMRTLKHLEVHQFLEGQPENRDIRPCYGRHIFQWSNINSLLKAMVGAPSGVTINLIRHPVDPYQSYFAFAIRNGGNLFVFTDREKTPHPLAADLRRRPDKILAARVARNWFPYELLGLEWTEDGHLHIKRADGFSLVPYQHTAFPLKPIAELEPPVVVWITMMLDLIVDTFWDEALQVPALSYTGEMVRFNRPLIDTAQAAGLPVPLYHALTLPPLTLDDVRDTNIVEDDVGKTGARQNKWLELRYGGAVSDEALNLISSPSLKLIQELSATGVLGQVSEVDPAARRNKVWSDHRGEEYRVIELDSLDASSFGTASQLDQDRRFVARSNFAKQIDKLARAEFEIRKVEVVAWVRSRILSNLQVLRPMLSKSEVMTTGEDLDTSGHRGASTWRRGTQRRFMERVPLFGENAWRLKHLNIFFGSGKIAFQGKGWKSGRPTCFETGAPASYAVQFIPETREDLALLCGCPVKELPDVLQHWSMIKRDAGNHILDRVDPMDWQCSNPWQSLHFSTTVFLSLRAMKAIERQCSK